MFLLSIRDYFIKTAQLAEEVSKKLNLDASYLHGLSQQQLAKLKTINNPNLARNLLTQWKSQLMPQQRVIQQPQAQQPQAQQPQAQQPQAQQPQAQQVVPKPLSVRDIPAPLSKNDIPSSRF